jgi:8-oxo-dGTP pyrophosphatase MutT (NUDIX family)
MDNFMETVLFAHARLNVINRDNYVFTHTNNSIVYLLPYRYPQQDAYLLGRFEACPAHSQKIELYAITGQCEVGDDPLHVALKELYEEAGILSTPSQLVSLGSGYLTKQADTIAHFFAINITDMPRSKAPTDGSFFEQSSYCDWISRAQALAARCVGLQALLARAHL